MSKHIPGPWNVEKSPYREGFQIKHPLSCINGLTANFTLAYVHLPDETEVGYSEGALDADAAEANARLIAAAPEMLEVMKRALRLSREHPDFKLYAMEPFEQVIAKAEGRRI